MFRRACQGLSLRRLISTNEAVLKPQVNYSPDGFLLDPRPGKRDVLIKEWVSPISGRSFRIERAIPDDYDILTSLWIKNFNDTCNIVKHLNTEEDEWLPVFSPMVKNALSFPISVLAFEGEKLVGSSHASVQCAPDFDDRYGSNPVLGVQNPHLLIKSDYADDVAHFDFSPKVNKILAFLHACDDNTLKFYPEGITKSAYLEATNVHPSRQKDGIGSVIIPQVIRQAFKHDCQIVSSICVAAGTTKIARKAGYTILFDFPYSEYKVDGKVIFHDLMDGAKAASVASILNPVSWKGGSLRTSTTPVLI